MNRKEVIQYLDNISLIVLGIFLIAFPLLFTTFTTDALTLPKQILVIAATLLSLLLLGVRMIVSERVVVRITPLDIPVFLFAGVLLVSSLLAVNRLDSLFAAVPIIFAVFLFFALTNAAKNESSIFFLISSLLAGASILGLLSVLSYLKIYVFPFPATQDPSFSPFGLLLDHAIYLALMLPIGLYFAKPLLALLSRSVLAEDSQKMGESSSSKESITAIRIGYVVASLFIAAGLAVSLYQLIAVRKPVILPFETGFQIAFSAISQDTQRLAQGFFLGSGYGTFFTDFTRFKPESLNLNPTLWTFTFFRSSSFVLDLLTTTGILGLATFLFIIFKVVRQFFKALKENAIFISLILGMIGAFLLPFSFSIQATLFILLGLFAAIQGLYNEHKFFDVELGFLAAKKGFFAVSPNPGNNPRHGDRILPIITMLILTITSIAIGYFVIQFIRSDLMLQQSLIFAAQNNGGKTYDLQNSAIRVFPYRDANHRIFSQTNLALANSLAQSLTPGSTPSAQTQQTIFTLIQQSINAGRNSVTLSPQTAINWQNLSNIYRSLIGFGQNAANFAVLTNQQSIALDPKNPQQYLNLGGIYYQLGLWDDAQRQFQLAVNLKRDFANGYYNLGHALEQKGDLPGALNQYFIVQNLVANDKPNLDKINGEIDTLQKRIGQASAQPSDLPEPGSEQEPLQIATPSAQLPERKPPVKIPGPTEESTPSSKTKK